MQLACMMHLRPGVYHHQSYGAQAYLVCVVLGHCPCQCKCWLIHISFSICCFFIYFILVVVISLINSIPETEWSKSRSAFCDV